MRDIIKVIIGRMPSNGIFDMHTIIVCLLQNNSDAYLQNCKGRTTLSYHAYIGHIVNNIAKGGLIKRIGDSWSLNIHKNFSKCSCWKKQ